MKPGNLNAVFDRRLFQSALALVFAYLVLPTSLPAASYLCEHEEPLLGNCMDASWVISLHWALEKGLVFGRDYLFTYGPLGLISTRTAIGFSHLWFLVSDLFIVANLTFILLYAFRQFRNIPALFLCLLIAYATAGGAGVYMDQIAFTLLLISLFWLNFSAEHSEPHALIIPALVTALLFFIKVNISFIGLALFYLHLLYFIFSDRRFRLSKILYGMAVPVLIVLLSFPLNTDLVGYVGGGLQVIDGYNDAMSLKTGDFLPHLIIALLLLASFPAVFFLRDLRANFGRKLLLLLTFGIFSFVLFKQSFVRSDLHVAIFFTFFPALCGLLAVFHRPVTRLQAGALGAASLICLFCGMSFFAYAGLGDRLNYFAAVFFPNDIGRRYEESFERLRLPRTVLETIGAGTVDVIPSSVNHLYFNRLNYAPRPVIQSYSAYTPYLIRLNGEKYSGETAPDFVIFSNSSIDRRYPLFDDQQAKLALIRDYSCLGLYHSESGGDFLLFRREPGRGAAAAVNFSEPVGQVIKFNEHYPLKDPNKSYFIKIQVDYSLAGRVVRALYKPFPIVVNFALEDGSARQYRAVVPILKSGVLINPLVEDEKDFLRLAEGGPTPPGKKIKSFSIELDSPGAAASRVASNTFEREIKLTISEMTVERTAE